MLEDLKVDVLKYFPANGRLAYEDFICGDIVDYYYRDEPRIKRVFDLISCAWTEIQWAEVEKIGFDGEAFWGHLVISRLTKKSFIHVFPSLLIEVAKSRLMTSDYFIDNHLDVRSVFRDWELEFYFSFNEDIVRLINRVLKANGSSCAQDAIYVYWHESGTLEE
jgi:hypothetical protein